MKERILKLLDVEPEESGPVFLLLAISFALGLFLATVSVASQSLFLLHFSENVDLPVALALSGALGIVATAIYNFFQGRIPFSVLAIGSLIIVMVFAAFLEFGGGLVENPNDLYYYGFTLILPFTFITQLVFWGAFNRMFNIRQAKRIIGSVDLGTMIAQMLGFFTIPVLLNAGVSITALYSVALFSIIGYLVLFLLLANRYLGKGKVAISEEEHEKIGTTQFLKSRYLVLMSLFIILSMTALRFVDYSFFNATVNQFNNDDIPYFLSLFEGLIVIFSFLFTMLATDRIIQEYGLRVTLLITPALLLIFTLGAFALGSYFGFDKTAGSSVIFFFIMIAMSKLLVNSLREAVDNPAFKFYYVPIDKSIKVDAQTKLEGFVTALASTIAGGLIVFINQFHIFNLLSVTVFTIPIVVFWYLVINRMYRGYRDTLQNSLVKNKTSVEKDVVREYTMDSVLEKEVRSTAEEKVIYGLRLMEKLEPALFETSIISLADSNIKKVRQFAQDKIQELGLNQESEIKSLAQRAAGELADSDFLSIGPEKLMRLSKSVKREDRLLAAKLLRKLVSPKTIFMLLELMRDADPKVRTEAILTARKVKRPETWGVLIELLSSPSYSHQAASALKEAGQPALNILETAFHKSGQSDLVMLKIVQIIGHIGGKEGIELLWKKVDYPDKRIVKQILYSLRFVNYQATGREVLAVKDLLDVEMSKTLWNLTALEELPEEGQHFKFLREALREEIRDNYDHLTLLLSLLYDPESVQLVKENVEAGTPDSMAYGMELLDLFVDQDLKPKLIPLLDESPTSQKLEKLQIYFPRESYNPVQTINYILNRDFNYNNRWSKLCAVYASAYIPNFRVSRGLISQMFNQDKLLQETAAWVIYNKDKNLYPVITERLPLRDKRFLDSAIENNQMLDGLDDGFFLGIEMVLFIKALPAFKGISGNLISELADKVIPVEMKPREKVTFDLNENAPILILAHGEVKLKNGDHEVALLKPGDTFGDLFQEGPSQQISEMEATQRSVVFKINLPDFYFAMANHHDLVQGLIKNVTGKKLKEPV